MNNTMLKTKFLYFSFSTSEKELEKGEERKTQVLNKATELGDRKSGINKSLWFPSFSKYQTHHFHSI